MAIGKMIRTALSRQKAGTAKSKAGGLVGRVRAAVKKPQPRKPLAPSRGTGVAQGAVGRKSPKKRGR